MEGVNLEFADLHKKLMQYDKNAKSFYLHDRARCGTEFRKLDTYNKYNGGSLKTKQIIHRRGLCVVSDLVLV